MTSEFSFSFINRRKEFNRKYKFNLLFIDANDLEESLDWAENSDDLLNFLKEMGKYGTHDISYNPKTDFYGFESDDIPKESYIKVMEQWRDFFMKHSIKCTDIEEEFNDKLVVFGV